MRMEIRDPSDHRRAGDEVMTALDGPAHQVDVACVSFNEGISGMIVVRARHFAVLRVVVQSHDLVASPQQFLDHVPTDEARCSGNEHLLHDGTLAREESWSTLRRFPNAKR